MKFFSKIKIYIILIIALITPLIFSACKKDPFVIEDNVIISVTKYGKKQETLEIPLNIVEIKERAFENCSKLKYLNIPSNVVSIGQYAFNNCNQLQYNNYENVNYLGDDKNLYNWLIKPQYVSITSCVMNAKTKYLFHNAFNNCITLRQIDFSEDLEFIGCNAFENCTSLENLVLPNNLLTIDDNAFNNCSNLESVIIPTSVMKIGNNAFAGCNDLNIYYKGSPMDWEQISIGFNFMSSNSKVYCYSETEPLLDGDYWYYDGDNLAVWNTEPTEAEGLEFELNEDGQSYSIKSKGTLNQTKIILPSTYENKPITKIKDEAFKDCDDLIKVIIPSTYKEIGKNAFKNCENLTYIDIPSSIETIGVGAFDDCSIRYNVFDNGCYLGNETNPYLWFIKALDVSIMSCQINENTKYIYHNAFENCSYMYEISFPSNVEFIGKYAFANCLNLQYINFDENTKISYIDDGAFSNCESMYMFTIPKTLKKLGKSVFENCYILMSVNFEEECIISLIGEKCFANCYALKYITLPETILTIENNAFLNCVGLNSMTIPSSVSSIGENIFEGCFTLVQIINLSTQVLQDLPNNIGLEVLTNNNDKFVNELIYNDIITFKVDEAVYVLGMCTTYITDLIFTPDITDIYAYAFYNQRYISTLTINENIKSIGTQAFYSCLGLENIIFDDDCQLTNLIGFEKCERLSKITIPTSIETIGDNAFKDCNRLIQVEIPNNVNSIGNYAFSGCKNLIEVTIPESVTTIGENVFVDCFKLVHITNLSSQQINNLPQNIGLEMRNNLDTFNNVLTIGEKYITYAVGVDNYLLGLSKYDIVDVNDMPNNITKIYPYAFYGNDVIMSIEIGNGVSRIGESAFENCVYLENVTLKEYGPLTYIANRAFYNCKALRSIVIPMIVRTIGINAFSKTSLDTCEFKINSGWYITKNESANLGIPITIDEFENPWQIANYLSDIHSEYFWKRNG